MKRYSLIVSQQGQDCLYAQADSIRLLAHSGDHWLNNEADEEPKARYRIIDNETGEEV